MKSVGIVVSALDSPKRNSMRSLLQHQNRKCRRAILSCSWCDDSENTKKIDCAMIEIKINCKGTNYFSLNAQSW